MTFKIYLRLIGTEAAIRSFNTEASTAHSSVTTLRRQAGWPTVPATEPSWQWQTKFVEAQSDTVEATIAQYVDAHRSLAALIKKHRIGLTLASLVVVVQCAEEELPSGLYISTGTISALHELGVDVDVDFMRAT
jgi:hypothetical protein